jgi:hypothetical protein
MDSIEQMLDKIRRSSEELERVAHDLAVSTIKTFYRYKLEGIDTKEHLIRIQKLVKEMLNSCSDIEELINKLSDSDIEELINKLSDINETRI